MSARMRWDRRTLHWLSLWVMTREAAPGSVSLEPQDHHSAFQQPREIRSNRQSWTTTKSPILARSGMAGRAASCQPYSAEMRCRRIRFETCHCRRRASIMPRALWTIELMTCESMTRLLCWPLSLAKPHRVPQLAAPAPPNRCPEKLTTERLRGEGSRCSPHCAHVGIARSSARLMADAVQFRRPPVR